MLEDCESSYEELLFKCCMSTLEIQRARNLAIEAYKSIHRMTSIYIQEMFNIKVTPYDLRDPCRTVMSKAKTTTHVFYPLHMTRITSGTLCPCILNGRKP